MNMKCWICFVAFFLHAAVSYGGSGNKPRYTQAWVFEAGKAGEKKKFTVYRVFRDQDETGTLTFCVDIDCTGDTFSIQGIPTFLHRPGDLSTPELVEVIISHIDVLWSLLLSSAVVDQSDEWDDVEINVVDNNPPSRKMTYKTPTFFTPLEGESKKVVLVTGNIFKPDSIDVIYNKKDGIRLSSR